MDVKPVAYFKTRPTQTLPPRPGPVQCVRNCANCIIGQEEKSEDADEENIIALRSYVDIVIQESLRFPRYRAILYHPGQVDVVKNILKRANFQHRLIYIVACSSYADLEYFRMVMHNKNMLCSNLIEINSSGMDLSTDCPQLNKGNILLPIKFASCPLENKKRSDGLLSYEQVLLVFKSIISKVTSSENNEQIRVLPVIIVKEYDISSKIKSLFAYGSLCVQLLEPYLVNEYVKHLHFREPVSHFVKHIYHDVARHAAKLPCHLVAFILLYRQEPETTFEDLVEYVSWLRSASLEFDLQLAFTGSPEHVVKWSLEILKEYIHFDRKSRVFRPIHLDYLFRYAQVLVPNFICYGLICRAILSIHNSDSRNVLRVRFDPEIKIRVLKDDVMDLSIKMAENTDKMVHFRKPCITPSACITDTFSKMQTFGKYFRIEEPKCRQNNAILWCEGYDSDEDYYWSKKNDPAFKSWLLLTRRPYRLDRLNMLLNAADTYMSSPMDQ